ncbi:hypothetical protein Tco_1085921, partial [Tanacetum coccineum]
VVAVGGALAGGEWRGNEVGEMMMRLRWCVGGGDVMEVVAAWSGGEWRGGALMVMGWQLTRVLVDDDDHGVDGGGCGVGGSWR